METMMHVKETALLLGDGLYTCWLTSQNNQTFLSAENRVNISQKRHKKSEFVKMLIVCLTFRECTGDIRMNMQ